MTTGRDDDALTWDGDDDPTLDVGASAGTEPAPDAATRPSAPELPPGYTAVGKGSETVGAADTPDAASVDEEAPVRGDAVAESRSLGNGALVALGVLGGVYALYAIGWVIGGLRLQGRAQYLVLDVMYQGSLWLAVLAPVLWFATTFLLTRRSRAWVRFAWLAVGVVLLLPWPFVMIGAIGQ
ncbi:DNA polymerase III subunit gamma/tau [Microbacterium sp. QXD-8]|uniref:DNA polymerase III subunit gamma/tau n=1 Tax=Microbacterium psychrotolerans TaxID=3068321 RepID=A0ABU0YYT8_9MICO|nr:DNA polymerase III subunit gamma/tau [Microbacterium sp. QXD-8]MDQ7877502.1 DNA polymerase III subunit gamma/tau [Microbacterium sp. QXD-8]